MNTRDRSRVKQLVVSGDCLTHMFTTGEKRAHRVVNGLPDDAEFVHAEYSWFPCELRLTYWSASFPVVPPGGQPGRLDPSVVAPVYTNADVVLSEDERTPPTATQREEMTRFLGVDPVSGPDTSVEVFAYNRGTIYTSPPGPGETRDLIGDLTTPAEKDRDAPHVREEPYTGPTEERQCPKCRRVYLTPAERVFAACFECRKEIDAPHVVTGG